MVRDIAGLKRDGIDRYAAAVPSSRPFDLRTNTICAVCVDFLFKNFNDFWNKVLVLNNNINNICSFAVDIIKLE